MDKATAQAFTELVTHGRFSDDTTDAIHKALGQHVDEESGLVVSDEDAKSDDDEGDDTPTKAAATKATAARKS